MAGNQRSVEKIIEKLRQVEVFEVVVGSAH